MGPRLVTVAAFAALTVLGTGCNDDEAGRPNHGDPTGESAVTEDGAQTDGSSVPVDDRTGSDGGSSSIDLGMTVSDMLPNAKWQWAGGTTAYSDIVVVGTVERAREGATRPGGPEAIQRETRTALIDLRIERAFGHDGDVPWGDTITVEARPSIPVGESMRFWLDLFAGMGRSVWTLDLDDELVNENVTGTVAWQARVGPDGRLLGPRGGELRADFTAGVVTLDELHAQANKADYYINPSGRISASE